MLFFKKKEIYKYNIMEKIKINLEKLKNNSNVEIIHACESQKYNFYIYKPEGSYSSKYILAQSKEKPNLILFLGKAYQFIEVFKNHLFLCNSGGEFNRPETFIKTIDLETGKEINYNLRGDYSKFIAINGYGRFHTTDKYIGMKVLDNQLVISGEREKDTSEENQNAPYNDDIKFEIIFEYKNGSFIPLFKTGDDILEFQKDW